jgi:hypothetical protein
VVLPEELDLIMKARRTMDSKNLTIRIDEKGAAAVELSDSNQETFVIELSTKLEEIAPLNTHSITHNADLLLRVLKEVGTERVYLDVDGAIRVSAFDQTLYLLTTNE